MLTINEIIEEIEYHEFWASVEHEGGYSDFAADHEDEADRLREFLQSLVRVGPGDNEL